MSIRDAPPVPGGTLLNLRILIEEALKTENDRVDAPKEPVHRNSIESGSHKHVPSAHDSAHGVSPHDSVCGGSDKKQKTECSEETIPSSTESQIASEHLGVSNDQMSEVDGGASLTMPCCPSSIHPNDTLWRTGLTLFFDPVGFTTASGLRCFVRTSDCTC